MTRMISLALQGGGAHGAFTWGVLDQLLQDERIEIEAISGTSAGAMNAAAVLCGYSRNGREGAREALEAFWTTISRYAVFSPVQRTWWDQLMGNWSLENSPAYQWSNWLSTMVSPYQSNPLDISPLRNVLEEQINVEDLHRCQSMRIFVAATNVRTGQVRIFDRDTFSIDALLASACLPHVYQAIEIDGEAYWDGGYMGNPAIWPLIYNAETADMVLVQINPLNRAKVPETADEIHNRLDEITFNSSLMHEMRAIAFVQRLLEKDALKEPLASQYKNVRMHLIADLAGMASLDASSKMNVEWSFLSHLKTMGQQAAQQWLADHVQAIGKYSTLNIRETFL